MALLETGVMKSAVTAQAFPAGNHLLTPETIEPGISAALLLIDVRQVESLTADIAYFLEYSLDGGTSWHLAGGGGLNLARSGYALAGKTLTNKEGAPVRLCGIRTQIPRTDLTRLLRVSMTIDEPLPLGITLVGL